MNKLLLLPLLFFFSFQSDMIRIKELDEVEGLFSVYIIKNDKTIFQEYYHDRTEEDVFDIHSETKSLVSILIGIAIEEGYIKSVDQKISDFFPKLSKDTAKSKITIKHLLNQTSGLQEYEWPKSSEWKESSNPTTFILSKPLLFSPGTKFQYNTAATHVLSAILSNATKMDAAAYADKHILKPLGITNYSWDKMNDGYSDGGGVSVKFRTEDMAKIGNLLLHKGKYKDQQLIPEWWVNELFSFEKAKAPWGLPGSVYGLCWYNGKIKGNTTHYATGYAGQLLFIFPQLNAVVAVNHDNWSADGNKQSREFLNKYLPLVVDVVKDYKE